MYSNMYNAWIQNAIRKINAGSFNADGQNADGSFDASFTKTDDESCCR